MKACLTVAILALMPSVVWLLRMLLAEPLLRHNGPSTMRATISQQTVENRWVVHLLH